jgi:hypothetical protein
MAGASTLPIRLLTKPASPGDQTWPRPTWWLYADQNPLVQERMHDAFMVGVTDEETRALLAKLGYLP